ncbi:hypothetical protein [Nocardioides gilvus]|uniref:hypothetical protein n=1 Tax=Nocardioides gilvus TaxID=1735589 RepID=UPI000D746A35|nr:hypothetical protein [Nocardioides gilvus]
MAPGKPLWRTYGWVIGCVVGLASAVGAGVAMQEFQEGREQRDLSARIAEFERGEELPAPVDAVRQLLEQPGRVAVDPELSDRVGEQHLARVEAALARAEAPARVAYLRAPLLDSGYRPSGAAAQWAHAIGERGFYVVLFDDGRAEIQTIDLEKPYLDAQVKGQPGPAMVRIAEEMATWEAEERTMTPVSDFDEWGGFTDGAVFALLAGGFVVAPAFFALRAFSSRKRKAD